LAEQAGSIAEQAQDAVSEMGTEARAALENMAQTQKQSGAELLQAAARAAGAAAEELEKASPELAGYIRRAAEGLDRYGQDFNKKSIAELTRGFSDFAHRDPTILLAGSVIAGFLLTRFVKSSDGGTSSHGGMSSQGMSSQGMSSHGGMSSQGMSSQAGMTSQAGMGSASGRSSETGLSSETGRSSRGGMSSESGRSSEGVRPRGEDEQGIGRRSGSGRMGGGTDGL